MDSPPQPDRKPAWPRYAVPGVILFLVLAALWTLTFVQRVKRIRESTFPQTNSATHATNGVAPAR